jgi:NAD(P)-dependent dehydrogenase (short-subunit alcohol dehydrogenase family)
MTTKNWTAEDLPNLSGKTFIVTGATSGLGAATARTLAVAGAHVVLAVRDVEKGREVAATIIGTAEVRELDLVPEAQTPDRFELQIGTNHLGHFALTSLLLPRIRERIVTLSSDLHRGAKLDLRDLNWRRRRYDASQAYKDSKLANLLFARELQRRLAAGGSHVLSLATHPGIVRTGLFGHVDGLAGFGLDIGSRIVGHDVSQGILPTLYAATQDVPGGSFIGPNGFRQLRGFPEVVTSSPAGEDAALAQRLWELSESLTATIVGGSILRSVRP